MKIRRGDFKRGERKSCSEYEAEAVFVGKCLVHPTKKSVARKIWQMRHGPLSSRKLEVCHTCDNPRCILDAHHFIGTQKDNMHDASIKGRMLGTLGRKFSPETCAKISQSKMGHTVSVETRAILSDVGKGRVVSSETRSRISAKLKGRISPMKGRHHTRKTKLLLSKAGKGRKMPPEFGKHLSEVLKGRVGSFTGKHHTKMSKQKIRAKALLQHARRRRLGEKNATSQS